MSHSRLICLYDNYDNRHSKIIPSFRTHSVVIFLGFFASFKHSKSSRKHLVPLEIMSRNSIFRIGLWSPKVTSHKICRWDKNLNKITRLGKQTNLIIYFCLEMYTVINLLLKTVEKTVFRTLLHYNKSLVIM